MSSSLASTVAPASSSTSTTGTWPFSTATCSGSRPRGLPRAIVSMSCNGIFAEVMHVEQMATSGERMNYWEIPHSCAQFGLGLSHRSECPELRPTSEAATKLASLLHQVGIFAEKVPHLFDVATLSSHQDVPASVRLRRGQKCTAGDVGVVFWRRPKYQGTTRGGHPAMYQTWRGDMMKYTSMRRMKTLKLPDWAVAETLIEQLCVLGKTSLHLSRSVRNFPFLYNSD